jgi:hypothetical protein
MLKVAIAARLGSGDRQGLEAKMRFLALIGALAIVVAIAGAIYVFGGFYNVGQTAANPAIVDWTLASVRGASVAARGTATPPASIVTEGRRTPIGPNGRKG